MHANYTIADLKGTSEAAALLWFFLFVPGFVTGWTADLFHFRRRRLLTQLLLSTPLAIAVTPICVFLLGNFGGFPAIYIAYGVIWAAFLVILIKTLRWSTLVKECSAARPALMVVLIWIAIAVLSLVDFQFGGKLYFSVSAYDHSLRTGFISAVTRGIPPANPYFAAFGDTPLRYHYFWMMMCALPARLGGIPPLQALYGGTLWIGFGLLSSVVCYLKFFLEEKTNLARKAVIACGLLLVTGLDLLPALLRFCLEHRLDPDLEWWNDIQVASWADSLIWVPHYLAALIACLIGFLLLWEASRESTRSRQIAPVVLAGAAFASATGLGLYVALVFAIFFVLWIFQCVARNWIPSAVQTICSGLVAIALALPYLRIMQSGNDGAKFAVFEVRVFSPPLLYLYAHGVHSLALLRLVSFICLPLNYFLELGFFLVVAHLSVRRLKQSGKPMARPEVAAWTLLAASFLVGSFVASATIHSNDLGMRVMLPAQFILLLWAAPMLDDLWFERHTPLVGAAAIGTTARWILMATLGLGLAATLYQVATLRLYPILMDQGKVEAVDWMAKDRQLGERTMAMREAYEAIHSQLPKSAVMQANPVADDYVPETLYADRAFAAQGEHCGVEFGGSAASCAPVAAALKHIFNEPAPDDGQYIDQLCRRFSIRALLVKDTDAVWFEKTWVWQRQPSFASPFVRVIPCGDSTP